MFMHSNQILIHSYADSEIKAAERIDAVIVNKALESGLRFGIITWDLPYQVYQNQLRLGSKANPSPGAESKWDSQVLFLLGYQFGN